MSADLTSRYADGDVAGVWHDLRSGAHVAEHDRDGVLLQFADRVARNVEKLVERLRELDYWFALSPTDGTDPLVESSQGVARETLDELDDILGKTFGSGLPNTCRVLLERVPYVDFMGTSPRWEPTTWSTGGSEVRYSDPMSLPSRAAATSFLRALRESDDPNAELLIYSPDELHKANVSGGLVQIAWPQPEIDLLFDGPTSLSNAKLWLVDYLNLCFEWGGFPGFGYCEHAPLDDIEFLSDGLVRV
jgi:hypothetical protein